MRFNKNVQIEVYYTLEISNCIDYRYSILEALIIQ